MSLYDGLSCLNYHVVQLSAHNALTSSVLSFKATSALESPCHRLSPAVPCNTWKRNLGHRGTKHLKNILSCNKEHLLPEEERGPSLQLVGAREVPPAVRPTAVERHVRRVAGRKPGPEIKVILVISTWRKSIKFISKTCQMEKLVAS